MKEKITEEEAYDMYDEMLNEFYPVKIGYVTFDSSKLLAEEDPIAYRTGFHEYVEIIMEDYDTSGWR